MKKILIFLLTITTIGIQAQGNLQSILKSSRQFDELVLDGENYFREKHPNIPFAELSMGEHRDGEFVKFMRWRKFWSERLNADGSLGDPSAYWQKHAKQGSTAKIVSPYADVTWTNISYEDYIISQIGLGRTTSIGFHPSNSSTFYVGAAIGGIWKTTDGGQSYTPLGDDLPLLAVSSIVVDQANPNTIYIAVSDHVWYGPGSIGVYKSTDGGNTWNPTALSFDIQNDIRIYWMEADPNDPTKMMVATQNGVYRTTDGFSSVSQVSTVNAFSVRFKPSDSSIVYVGGRNGEFLKSTNGGTSFSQITDLGSSNVMIAVTSQDVQKVFVRNGSTLHKSFNSGTSFTQTSAFSTGSEVFVFAPSDDDIIISGNFECYRSVNGGSSFSAITHWLGDNGLPNIHVDQRNMFTNPLESDAVYLCNDGGVYRYTISTNTFTNLSNGLMITQFYDIAVSQTDSDIIGGGSQDNGNVFRNSGGTWSQYANTGDGMNQEIDPTDEGIRYWAYQNGGMRRWQSGSNTNISPSGQNGNGAWETPFKLDPSDSDRLICAYDRVYESLNNGTSWAEISGQLAGGSDMNELAIAPTNGERIYVTQSGNLYVKNTNNDNWATKSLPNGAVSDIEVDFLDMNTVYVSVPGYNTGNKVFKSINAGDTWTNISGTLPDVSVGALELLEGFPGGVFIGTDAGVFYLDDGLTDWVEYGALPHTRVEDIEIQYAAELIRIGTHGRGVLEAPLEIEVCTAGSPDSDGDGTCDIADLCPSFDNNLIGTACDDGDSFSSGEEYTSACQCEGGAANLTYCDGLGGSNTGSDYINRVTLTDIDQSSGKTGYSDFRTTSTRLDHGQAYPVSVQLNYSFPLDRVHVWIDYDRSGTFDASEAVSSMSIPVNNNHISTGTINVPLDAVKGATTMRVRVVYSTTFDDPCGTIAGEVEDYTVFLDCVSGSTGPQCLIVPLEWLSFTAETAGANKAKINWQTTKEISISHFEIERSFDGTNFIKIGRQDALSNGDESQYNFLDEQVNGSEAYYRLKAVDLDGSFEYSVIRRVSWKNGEEIGVSVYPNPATSILYVNMAQIPAGEIQWFVRNLTGQELSHGVWSEEIVDKTLNISSENLPAGMYLLRLQYGDGETSVPFVKEE